MLNQTIRLLELSGSPYQRGFQHGTAYRDEIRRYAADRVHLVSTGLWSGGAQLTRDQVLDLAEACVPDHEAYAPNLMDELRGMADATGLSLGEMIVVGGFTDFIDTVYDAYRPVAAAMSQPIDDCTAFIVPDDRADGQGFFGQTWDMHDTATEFVILLRVLSNHGPRSLVFTTTGCVGQIGMNSAGICVGINNLMGADGQIGVTWPFVVRKVLQQDNIEDALACITEAKLAGAHNYLLFDAEGNGYNIEAMPSQVHVERLNGGPIVHTNHCLIPETQAVAQVRPEASQASSEARLNRGYELLESDHVTIHDLIELTRDEEAICVTSKPPFHVESCGAAIMRPKSGDFWAVWGLPKDNEYEHFVV